MTPKDFPEKNITFVHKDCVDLPAYKGHGMVISAWELSAEDLEIIQKTKTIYLSVWGDRTPPIALYVECPFRDTSEYPEILEEKP